MALTWFNHLCYTLICHGLFLLTLWLLRDTFRLGSDDINAF